MCFWTCFSQLEHHYKQLDKIFKFSCCGFFENFSVFFGLSGSLILSCLLACNAIFVVSQRLQSSASLLCHKLKSTLESKKVEIKLFLRRLYEKKIFFRFHFLLDLLFVDKYDGKEQKKN